MENSVVSHTFGEKTNTHYVSVQITSGNTVWSFLKAVGERGYVSCRKVSNNPFGTLGKDYKDFDQAQENYKAPLVKSMILLAESLLNAELKKLNVLV